MILAASVILLVVSAWAFYPVARVQYQEERNRARLAAELDGLKERNAELRAQVDRLKTPEGVEQVAREDLGMVREGENLYVIMDPEGEPTSTAALPAEQKTQQDVWLEILDAVFGFEE